MLIWTLLQRWEKLWCADLQSWQINLSSRSPWAILQTQMHRTGRTSSTVARIEASCVLKVVHTAPKPTFSSFKQLGHTCQEFGTTTAVLTPGHTQIPRFLSAKLSRKGVTELRTRFSGKRRILCSSLAVASPAFRADQRNSKITQLWIHGASDTSCYCEIIKFTGNNCVIWMVLKKTQP